MKKTAITLTVILVAATMFAACSKKASPAMENSADYAMTQVPVIEEQVNAEPGESGRYEYSTENESVEE